MGIEHKLCHNNVSSETVKKHNEQIEKEAFDLFNKLTFEEKKKRLIQYVTELRDGADILMRQIYYPDTLKEEE